MKFFQSVSTLEELKKEYRKLCFKYHPDRGSSREEFQELNNEYEKLKKEFEEERKVAIDEKYMEIIDQLRGFDVTIKIVGTWIWVEGDTEPIKNKLKELKMRWAPKKKKWYFHLGSYRRWGKKEYSMEEIEKKYKVTTVRTSSSSKNTKKLA
jgi:hypothetical protein